MQVWICVIQLGLVAIGVNYGVDGWVHNDLLGLHGGHRVYRQDLDGLNGRLWPVVLNFVIMGDGAALAHDPSPWVMASIFCKVYPTASCLLETPNLQSFERSKLKLCPEGVWGLNQTSDMSKLIRFQIQVWVV